MEAHLAQQVVHLICNQEVGGSNPSVGTIYSLTKITTPELPLHNAHYEGYFSVENQKNHFATPLNTK